MWCKLFKYERQRQCLLKKAPEGALHDYLSTPFPNLDTPITELDILAVDFETTGLNPKQSKILSVGSIAIKRTEIHVSTAFHKVINTGKRLQESNVVVHQIMDEQREQGHHDLLVISDLLHQMKGKVMLVHYAPIERRFLTQACKEIFGMAPVWPIIDTYRIAQRRFERQSQLIPSDALRLHTLRQAHELPRYRAHNALSDALATAELFLADLATHQSTKVPTLKDYLV